jgi:hypothetical protein
MGLNLFGQEGRIPEGMTATAALRHERFAERHARRAEETASAVARFRESAGYTPPYWELVKLARAAR